MSQKDRGITRVPTLFFFCVIPRCLIIRNSTSYPPMLRIRRVGQLIMDLQRLRQKVP